MKLLGRRRKIDFTQLLGSGELSLKRSSCLSTDTTMIIDMLLKELKTLQTLNSLFLPKHLINEI